MSVYNLDRFGPSVKMYITSVSGPSQYAAGGFTVSHPFSKVLYAIAIGSGGYLAEAVVSGNTVKVKVYYFDYAAASAGPAVEVPDSTDLSSYSFTVIIIGAL